MAAQRNQFMLSSNGTFNSILTTDPTSSRPEVSYSKKENPQQDEWGEEDAEFELEEEEVRTEVSEVIKLENDIAHATTSAQNTSTKINEIAPSRDSLSGFSPSSQTPVKEETISHMSPSMTPEIDAQSSSKADNLLKTKYGRKVHRPVLFTPDSRDTKRQSQETKRPNKSIAKCQRNLHETSQNSLPVMSSETSPTSNNTPQNSSAEDDTQCPRRSKLDDIVCTVCHDGRSPKHNRIVLCDRCDVPYHQQCHVPSIEDRVVEIPTAEWVCSKCEDVKGRRRRKVKSSNNSARDISGNGLTEEQKIAYLSSLPQRVLIDLILIAEKLHPDLPLYPADVKEQIANNVYTSMANNNNIDDRPASKDSLPHPPVPAVPQVSNTQSSKSYSDSTNPSRAHLPAVGVDLPSYEEMIVQALLSIADPAGCAPRNIFEWMNNTYPLHKNFRASASQALQKAVKKGRVLRIGTVYNLNADYKPTKRIRRYFKKPLSPNEHQHQSYKDDVAPEDEQDGVYEIAVRMDDSDNFTPAQGMEVDDHPSISSSAVSTPAPHAISNGHTEVTSPEENSSTDDTSNKIVPVLVNESSNSMSTMMQNQSLLPPVRGRGVTSNINSGANLPSTLLPPPVQPTLPSLSSVAPYFSSGYGGSKSNSMYTSYQYAGTYNTGLPAITTLSRDENGINPGLSIDPTHSQ